MPRIFISYRRDDSRAMTGRIYDRLVQAFGEENIFKDVDRIPPGSTFAEVLDAELAKCNVLLIIIGRSWVNITDQAGQRRLENSEDFVRIEVEKGLNREGLLVIPVLVDEAAIPNPADLPDSLHKIASLQVVQVRHDPDFHRDMNRLIDFLKVLQHQEESVQGREQAAARRTMRRTLAGVGVLAVIAVLGFLALVANGTIKIGGSAEATFDPAGTAFAQLTQTDAAQVAAVGTTGAQASVEAILTQFVTETQIAGTLTAEAYTDTPTFTYTPSDTPTASSTPTETPTETPSATPTATANETTTVQAQLTQAARDMQRTQTALNVQETNDALATRNAPTNTPEPPNTPIPTESPTSTLTPTPTLTQTASVTPTRTPSPTTAPSSTLTATLTPTPNSVATQTAAAAALATAEENARATQASEAAIAESTIEAGNAAVKTLTLEMSAAYEGRCGAISPNGRWLIVHTDNYSESRVYDLDQGGTVLSYLSYKGSYNYYLKASAFSPDGRLIAVQDEGVFDLEARSLGNEGKLLALRGDGTENTNPITFSPDGKLVAVTGDGVYDVSSGTKRFAISGGYNSIVFSRDGSLVAVSYDGVYDVSSGTKRFAISSYGSIVFSPDGSLMAVAGDGVYDTNGEKRFGLDSEVEFYYTDVAFSPDGKLVAARGDGVYDLATGERQFDLPNKDPNYYDVAFSPDGRWFAVGDAGVYDVATNHKKFEFHDAYNFGSVLFSQDNQLVVVSGGIYDTATGRQLYRAAGIMYYPELNLYTSYYPCLLLQPSAGGERKGFAVTNNNAYVNIRNQPSANAGVVASQQGILTLTGKQDRTWYEVEYEAGSFGWVSGDVILVLLLPIIEGN